MIKSYAAKSSAALLPFPFPSLALRPRDSLFALSFFSTQCIFFFAFILIFCSFFSPHNKSEGKVGNVQENLVVFFFFLNEVMSGFKEEEREYPEEWHRGNL